MENMTFGDYVRARRLDLEIGLREFAEMIGMESSNFSKVERGLKNAPTGERLAPIIRALELEIDGPEHRLMDNLAHVANGEIPNKILTDKELAGKLPMFFSGMADGTLTEQQLDELYEIVRKAHTPEVDAEVA